MLGLKRSAKNHLVWIAVIGRLLREISARGRRRSLQCSVEQYFAPRCPNRRKNNSVSRAPERSVAAAPEQDLTSRSKIIKATRTSTH
jgi:hypothetical protein